MGRVQGDSAPGKVCRRCQNRAGTFLLPRELRHTNFRDTFFWLQVSVSLNGLKRNGEVSERFKEHAWKACVGETQPWVQIPPSPPYLHFR